MSARISTIISSLVERGILKLTNQPGKGVTNTNPQTGPFGIDANPYPGIRGFILSGLSRARGAIVGYFNKFVDTSPGEIRIYGTDANGAAIVAYAKIFNDGSIKVECNIGDAAKKYTFFVDANGNKYETINKDETRIIKGSCYSTIDGIKNEIVKGKKTLDAQGDYDISGDVYLNGNFLVSNGDVAVDQDIYGDNLNAATEIYYPGVTPGGAPTQGRITLHYHGYVSPTGPAYTTAPYN